MADVKYTYTFQNHDGLYYKVDFIQFGYSGLAATVKPTSLGFTKQYKGPDNEVYTPFIASEVTVELHNGVPERAMVQDMVDADAHNWFMIIYRSNDNITFTIDWRGVVNTDGITLPDAATLPPVDMLTIKADDGFGRLEKLRFTPTEGELESTLSIYYFLYEAIKEMTRDILIETDDPFIAMCSHWYEESMEQDTDIDPMSKTFVKATAFVAANDYGETVGMTWRDIWENILATWNLTVFQEAGLYYFVQLNRYTASVTYSKKYVHFKRTVDDPEDYSVGGMLIPVALPTRFAGGEYSNLSMANRVNAEYAYKSSMYGDSLLPKTILPTPITVLDGSFTHEVYTLCVSEEGMPLHIEGTAMATIRDTGQHVGDFNVIFALKIQCGIWYLNYDPGLGYYWDLSYIDFVYASSDIFAIALSVTKLVMKINFDTNPLPTSGDDITMEVENVYILEGVSVWNETDPAHTFSFQLDFQNDWLATIGLSGQMSGTQAWKAYSSDTYEYDLPETCIGDATQNFHVSKIKIKDSTDAVVNSAKWDVLSVGDYDYNVHEFRAREIASWVGRNLSVFSTQLEGELLFLNCFVHNLAYYAVIGATYYANESKYDVTMIQWGQNYTTLSVASIGTSNGNTQSGGGAYSGGGAATNLWRRSGTTLTPFTAGDNVNTSGIIGNVQTEDNYAVFPTAGQVELSSDDNSIKETAIMVGSIADEDTLFEKYLNNGTDEVYRQTVTAADTHSASNSGGVYKLSVTKQGDTTPTERIKIDKDGNVILNGSLYIEPDGTIRLDSAATVFNDINTGLNPRNTGSGRPTLASFVSNLQEFQFAVNDFADLVPIELMHDWKEGTEIEFHVHWATGGTNDTTVRGVKWEIEYTCANMEAAGGTIIFPTSTVISTETSIASGEAARTHKYTSVGKYTPDRKIGAQIAFRVKRIASVTNTAPATNPFLLSIGIHYEIDTIGSRTTSSK